MSAWREALTRFLSDDEPCAVVKSAEGKASGTHAPGASKAMQQMALAARQRSTPLLDRVFPPAECDFDPDQHPTMARRGGNCISDDEWLSAVSSDSPWGGQR